PACQGRGELRENRPRPPSPRFSGARGTAREPATARRSPRPPAPASQGRGELRETPQRPAGHHDRQRPLARGAGNCANPPAPRRSPPPPHPSLSANPAVQRTSSPAVMSSASTPGNDSSHASPAREPIANAAVAQQSAQVRLGATTVTATRSVTAERPVRGS